MTVYLDLHSKAEDERVRIIGEAASTSTRGVAVMLEKDEPEKIRRYIRKVTERYPGVMVIDTIDGPTPLLLTIKFGRRH